MTEVMELKNLVDLCRCIDRYSLFQKMELNFTLSTSFQEWASLSDNFQRTEKGKGIIVAL